MRNCCKRVPWLNSRQQAAGLDCPIVIPSMGQGLMIILLSHTLTAHILQRELHLQRAVEALLLPRIMTKPWPKCCCVTCESHTLQMMSNYLLERTVLTHQDANKLMAASLTIRARQFGFEREMSLSTCKQGAQFSVKTLMHMGISLSGKGGAPTNDSYGRLRIATRPCCLSRRVCFASSLCEYIWKHERKTFAIPGDTVVV